ncbi:MAG: hypothetical protein AAF519_04755 [Bacteroidota bacterium]
MKKSYTQYLVGILLVALAIYQAFKDQTLEFLTYTVAGLAFVMMGLMTDGFFAKYRKAMNVVSWVLTLLAGLLLLTLFRNDP